MCVENFKYVLAKNVPAHLPIKKKKKKKKSNIPGTSTNPVIRLRQPDDVAPEQYRAISQCMSASSDCIRIFI